MPAAPDPDTTASTRSPNTADTVLAPNADTVQVEARPADAQASVQPINRASFAGFAVSAISSKGFASRAHRARCPPQAMRSPVTNPPVVGTTVSEAILPRSRSPVHPVAVDVPLDAGDPPGGRPLPDRVSVPRPAVAGDLGARPTFQCATHSGCPRFPNQDEFRMKPRQK